MSQLKPAFQGELMLAGWNESHNGGVKITFWLPDSSELEAFKSMTVKKGNTAGQRLAVVMVEIDDNETPLNQQPVKPTEPKPEPNLFAKKLMLDGYFRNPKLWDAIEAAGMYSQAEHKAYIESQPCIYKAGRFGRCEGDVVLHHVRTAANSGTGIKPPHWYGVPLCHTHHGHIHSSQAIRQEREEALTIAVNLTADRMKEVVKRELNLDSLSKITPELLKEFELGVGL